MMKRRAKPKPKPIVSKRPRLADLLDTRPHKPFVGEDLRPFDLADGNSWKASGLFFGSQLRRNYCEFCLNSCTCVFSVMDGDCDRIVEGPLSYPDYENWLMVIEKIFL